MEKNVKANNVNESLRYFIRTLLIEGVINDLQNKYPLYKNEIEIMNKNDPSSTKKYLKWAMKQVVSNKFSNNDIISAIKGFHQRPEAFSSKDINFYKTVEDLRNELLKISPSKTSQKRDAKLGAIKVGNVDSFLIYRMDTREACVNYGFGTKWCISMSHKDDYWKDYASQVIIYLIIETKSHRKCITTYLPNTKNFYAYDEMDNVNNEIADAFKANEDSLKERLKSIEVSKEQENKMRKLIIDDYQNSPWERFKKEKMGPQEQEEFLKKNPHLK